MLLTCVALFRTYVFVDEQCFRPAFVHVHHQIGVKCRKTKK
jgi:hypothetical protein